jgi:hypothetical protein
MKAERSPWFRARMNPPVNGGKYAEYEWRCSKYDPLYTVPIYAYALKDKKIVCPSCEWRGLTERGVKQWKKGAR